MAKGQDKPSKSKRSTNLEMEERTVYIAWWMSRYGFYKKDVKAEIFRKFQVNARTAETIITSARERMVEWDQMSGVGRRELASNFWTSIISDKSAPLAQRMHAMECWQELHGLLKQPETTQPTASFVFVEQVISDRSQIARPAEQGSGSEV